MAKIISWADMPINQILREIRAGKIFIYPTDTIYGIGCDAQNSEAVMKIRRIKGRDEKPFSIIAPTKNWIKENFHIKNCFLEKLPGPYTYLLKPKKRMKIAKEVRLGSPKLGVRLPNHPFAQVITASGVPFVTTSVNKTGKKHVTNINGIPRSILKKVDYIIDYGTLNNKPSTIVDLTLKIPKIIRR